MAKPRPRAPVGQAFPSIAEIRARLVAGIGETDTSRVLAFDLSTTCIGWALGVDGQLLHYGKLIFKSGAAVGEKLGAWEEFASALIETFQPERVVLEKPLARRGVVTARHYELVGILRRVFARISGAEIRDDWFIPARSVKRSIGVRKGGTYEDRKRNMVNRVNEVTGLALRYHDGTKRVSDDDVADAIGVLLAHLRGGR